MWSYIWDSSCTQNFPPSTQLSKLALPSHTSPYLCYWIVVDNGGTWAASISFCSLKSTMAAKNSVLGLLYHIWDQRWGDLLFSIFGFHEFKNFRNFCLEAFRETLLFSSLFVNLMLYVKATSPWSLKKINIKWCFSVFGDEKKIINNSDIIESLYNTKESINIFWEIFVGHTLFLFYSSASSPIVVCQKF